MAIAVGGAAPLVRRPQLTPARAQHSLNFTLCVIIVTIIIKLNSSAIYPLDSLIENMLPTFKQLLKQAAFTYPLLYSKLKSEIDKGHT